MTNGYKCACKFQWPIRNLTAEWVCRRVVVSSGSSPLRSMLAVEQGSSFWASGGGQRLWLHAPRLGQAICSLCKGDDCRESYNCDSSSLSVFPAISLGFTIFGEVFAYVIVFYSNHRGSQILSLWMVRAGCIFVVGIHTFRTGMSGSFESVLWNACAHRLDLSLYSHLKEF